MALPGGHRFCRDQGWKEGSCSPIATCAVVTVFKAKAQNAVTYVVGHSRAGGERAHGGPSPMAYC